MAAFATGEIRGSGRVLNLGRAGLFVATPRPPDSHTPVDIVLEDPAGNKIEVKGTVRWSIAKDEGCPPGFGMAIEHPSEAYLDLYEELLRTAAQ